MNKIIRGVGFKRISFLGMLAMCLSCDTLSGLAHHETGIWSSGDAAHEVDVKGTARSFVLHTPGIARRNRIGLVKPYPLIVVLHGSRADGGDIQKESRFDLLADGQGFLVAYPDATHGTLGIIGSDWNAGTCCGEPADQDVDDVSFLLKVIDQISARVNVDSHRVYVAGFSDGGRMAYRLACAVPGRFAAIAVVSGSLRQPNCSPKFPVALVAFHGTADEEVPYNEPSDTRTIRAVPSDAEGLPPSLKVWAALNGCSAVVKGGLTAHVTRYRFGKCTGGEVVFYSIAGGRHAWPGGDDGVGSPESEIAATPAIVGFLLRHTRK